MKDHQPSGLPQPLTPPECDLSGLRYMPLVGDALFTSGRYLECSAEIFRIRMRLAWAAWRQVPAGSLPNSDASLALMADFGRDLESWRKVRDDALQEFVLCSDNRYYHPQQCAEALNSFDLRLKSDIKRKKDRERLDKWRKQKAGDQPIDETRFETVAETTLEMGFVAGRKDQNGNEVEKKSDSTNQVLGADGRNDLFPGAVVVKLPTDLCGDAVTAWNAMAEACGLSQVAKLTDARRRSLNLRLRECGGLDGWRAALEQVRASAFLLGKNDREWKADFDFILQPKSFTKLLEGTYANRGRGTKASYQATWGWADAIPDQRASTGTCGLEATIDVDGTYR